MLPVQPNSQQFITDEMDKVRDGSAPPFPNALRPVEKPRVYDARAFTLAIGEQRTVRTDIEVVSWHVVIPDVAGEIRVDVQPGDSVDDTALRVYPGYAVRFPSRGQSLTLRNRDAGAVFVQLFALANVPFWYDPPVLAP